MRSVIQTFCCLSLIFISFVSQWSCKSSGDKLPEGAINIDVLEKKYLEQPSDSLFQQLMRAIGSEIINAEKSDEKTDLIERAIKITENAKKESYRLVFIAEYLKANPKGSRRADYLYETAEYQLFSERKEVASVLFGAFIEKHPADKRVEEAKKHVITQQRDMANFMKKSAESAFIQPDSSGLQQKAAIAFIDCAEAYALGYPENTETAAYLFTAAEYARSLGQFPKMMNLYDWVIQYHPGFENSSLVLLLKGFALETEFYRTEDARKTYEAFLTKYPQDSLADDVKMLLQNLGKRPEEIIQKGSRPAMQ